MINISKLIFFSNDHIRYENGKDVSGHNYNCNRVISVEDNIEGGKGYTVTIFNADGNHPFWRDNVQMAPKQMEVVKMDENCISLRGFGTDKLGFSFKDYGITIYFNGNQITKVVGHMLDRNVDIEYLPDSKRNHS